MSNPSRGFGSALLYEGYNSEVLCVSGESPRRCYGCLALIPAIESQPVPLPSWRPGSSRIYVFELYRLRSRGDFLASGRCWFCQECYSNYFATDHRRGARFGRPAKNALTCPLVRQVFKGTERQRPRVLRLLGVPSGCDRCPIPSEHTERQVRGRRNCVCIQGRSIHYEYLVGLQRSEGFRQAAERLRRMETIHRCTISAPSSYRFHCTPTGIAAEYAADTPNDYFTRGAYRVPKKKKSLDLGSPECWEDVRSSETASGDVILPRKKRVPL